MKIIEKKDYRSKPLVNMAEDMVRVTLTMSIREWRELEKESGAAKLRKTLIDWMDEDSAKNLQVIKGELKGV